MKPPALPASLAFYDSGRKTFWLQNDRAEWMDVTETTLARLLRSKGVSDVVRDANGLTGVEAQMLRLQLSHDVAFAGPLSGHASGPLEVCGQRILVTRGPRLVKPASGKWDTLETLLTTLLRDGQHEYVLAWLKCALESLEAGAPFRPGQMLCIAGPAGCGKSLLQSVITELLGGRVAKPYRYMTGETAFNSELFGAEHLAIEDDSASTDIRARRHFGAALKNIVVNETQSFHAKGRAALTLAPFWRISVTLNDEPENLMILPPLDDSIRDKIFLLQASHATLDIHGDKPGSRAEYRQRLSRELPAFVRYLKRMHIPRDLRCARYGVKAWLHPELVESLAALAPETILRTLIDESGLLNEGPWIGSASELERALRGGTTRAEAERLFCFNTACGVYLGRLASKEPKRFTQRRAGDNRREWVITR